MVETASTGLMVLGNGQWQVHKHKTSDKRRTWRKLHLGIDGDGSVIASALTDRLEGDAYVGISMLEQIGGTVARFTADGGHDSRATGSWCQRNNAVSRRSSPVRRRIHPPLVLA